MNRKEEKYRHCVVGEWGLTQYGLNLSMPSRASILWVIYPRLAERRENGSSFAQEDSGKKEYPLIEDIGIDSGLVGRLGTDGDEQAEQLLQAFAQEEEQKKQKTQQQARTSAWLKSTGSPARFTSIADGRGVKVESASGTDYVFLGQEPFQYREGSLDFDGMAGSVSIRGGKTSLTLSEGRMLKYGKQSVTGEMVQ